MSVRIIRVFLLVRAVAAGPALAWSPHCRSSPAGAIVDESRPGHHGEIGPDCPVACLLTVMSRKAWLPLTRARGPLGEPPETVGDVLKMHARSRFRDIWGLGPRRIGEIETALVFTGFDLTASQHSAGSRVQSRPAEGKPEG